MRHFNYYLYENFDVEQLSGRQKSPRKYLNSQMDGIISEVADLRPLSCRYTDLCKKYSQQKVNTLINLGVLRLCSQWVVFDSTVILKDDAPALAQGYCVTPIVDNLERAKKDIYSLADRINNGFAASVNLYHILCGSIFDGLLFDYLSDIHVVSTSRQHASGLDYIITIYEDCPELNLFSRKLLCSYNRFTDGYRSLQSFGDSNGTRRDFYRFARLRELGAIPEEYADIRALWDNLDRENFRESLLDETQQLYEEGRCRKPYAELLNFFGYQRGGKITVPVFYKKHMDIICEIEQIVKTCVLEELKIILKEPGGNLICGSHGVPSKEIGNEIYHILFGLINEELVSRDYVCSPDELMSEGRYLKSIEFLR